MIQNRHLAWWLVVWLTPASAMAQPVVFQDNGHYYEFVGTQLAWADARAAATTRSFFGTSGHLVTITTPAENAFLLDAFASGEPAFFAWIGGYEPNDNGVWLWGAGPEDGTQFAQGAASTPPYNYVNWGGIEPNDFASGEDFAAMNLGALFAGVPPGAWIDSPNPNPSDPIRGYIVEYETGTPVGEPDGPQSAHTAPRLGAVYPNPMMGAGAVHIDVPEASELRVLIFDSAGRRVRTLISGVLASGSHRVDWDGRDDGGRAVAEGVYYFRLSADRVGDLRKAILLR